MQNGKECGFASGASKCKNLHCKKPHVSFLDDDEVVLRAIFAPKHYDKVNKAVKPAAFNYDVVRSGCSVDRAGLISKDKYIKCVQDLVEIKQERAIDKDKELPTLECVGLINVKAVRSIADCLFFCPSCQDDRPSHADIRTLQVKPSIWNKIRESLWRCCTPKFINEIDIFMD
jgi:hypothetical protein